MTPDLLDQYCIIAKKHDMRTLLLSDTNGFRTEIVFNTQQHVITQTTLPPVKGMPSEDEMLLWSAGGAPDLPSDK